MKIITPRVMTISIRTYIFVFTLLFYSSLQIKSQDDFESWNAIEFGYELPTNTNIWLSNELRLFDNSTRFKKYLVDVGADQELTKGLDATVSYRYTRFCDDDVFKNEHQINCALQYSYRLQRFVFSVQTRYQYSNTVFGYSTIKKTEKYWRNKASINYKWPSMPLTPYVSFEHFTELNTSLGMIADKYRIFAGLKYKLNKHNSLALYYGIQNSLQNTDRTYILGLKYAFNLKSKSKDDESSRD